jgi:hypothetical protein
VLPDDSNGQGPGTLARKLSRCKPARLDDVSRSGGEGMAHFLPSGYRVLWPLRVSRYRVVKELVNYPGAVKFIAGSGAVWVCQAILSCLGSRSKSPPVRPYGRAGKKRDKQLTHIVRVMLSIHFFCLCNSSLSSSRTLYLFFVFRQLWSEIFLVLYEFSGNCHTNLYR